MRRCVPLLANIPWGSGRVPQVSLEAALSLADSSKEGRVKVLDVRTPQEWGQSRVDHPSVVYITMSDIESAVYQGDVGAALESIEFPKGLGSSEEDACLVLCKAGVRSQHVAELLQKRAGRLHVANIAGGIMGGAW